MINFIFYYVVGILLGLMGAMVLIMLVIGILSFIQNDSFKGILSIMGAMVLIMLVIGILSFIENDVFKGILAIISAIIIVLGMLGIGTVNRRIIK